MKILFAYDGSEGADAAITAAGRLFGGRDGEAVVLSIWEPLTVLALRALRFGGPLGVPTDVAEEDEQSEEHARELADRGVRVASQAGFKAQALSVAGTDNIADAIVAAADEQGADVLVLGARGLSGVSAFLGSVSIHVVQHAHRPVLVVPPAGDHDR